MRHQHTPSRPPTLRATWKVRRIAPVAASLALTGCADVAIWGNVFSMLLTLAIFVGTLSLSRQGGQGEP